VLDDYSRYIISWRLKTKMATADVTDTLEDALLATGLSDALVCHKPRLLSDNCPCYVSGELKFWLPTPLRPFIKSAGRSSSSLNGSGRT